MLQFQTPDASQMDTVRRLFRDYQAELDIDLCFQGFEQELAALPGVYAEPAGSLYLAIHEGIVVGCGALKPIGEGVCELKRIYVLPGARGKGYGRDISVRLLDDAQAKGYKMAKLDTLSKLKPAIALYESLGFTHCAAYVFNPEPDVVYMEIAL